jgi:hypothetical protein
MRPEQKGLVAVGLYVAGLVCLGEWSNWRAGGYAAELPVVATRSADAWEPLRPSVPISALPQQASLYEAVTEEFAKDSRFVCIGTSFAPRDPTQTDGASDPPDDVVQLLKRRSPAFRPCPVAGPMATSSPRWPQTATMEPLSSSLARRAPRHLPRWL